MNDGHRPTLEEQFRDWYRATPSDAEERTERVLAAVRLARRPSRTWWQRLPPAIPWTVGVGLAASLVGLALSSSWLGHGTSSATQTVQFVLVAPAASRVALVGDFNGWDVAATPMHRRAPDEPWTAMVIVPTDRRVFTYAFILDGVRWMADPNAPLASTDDFGSATSVLVFGARNGGLE